MGEDYIIEMLNITKEFPGVKANDNVTLRLKKGEIHAILGENGAGKSTLMSVLFGLYEPTEGEIRKNGKKVKIKNPAHATTLGIGMVHQHFRLIEVFSVLDNIILGNESTAFGFLKRKKAEKKIKALSEKYSLHVNLREKAENLTVSMRQKTEILKMLYRENEVLIFDEPTSILTQSETLELMNTMKSFANEGKSILFITHKLHEIMAVSDRVTVMRKGKAVGTVNTKDVDEDTLCEMMVGKPFQMNIKKSASEVGADILKVRNLTVISEKSRHKPAVKNVSFTVKKGEIVSIAGIDGNGQNELIGAITGLMKAKIGEIRLLNENITSTSVRHRNELGISHIPDDIHKYGLISDFSLMDNFILLSYFKKEFQSHGFIKTDKVKTYAEKLITRFDIYSPEGPSMPIRLLSGGNQQKAVIGRELIRNKELIIAFSPARGLDSASTKAVHSELLNARKSGKGILLISLDLSEIMSLSDRILVIHEGEIKGEFLPEKTSATELGFYLSGAKEIKNEK